MDFSVFYLGGSVLLCLDGSGSKKMREERTRGEKLEAAEFSEEFWEQFY